MPTIFTVEWELEPPASGVVVEDAGYTEGRNGEASTYVSSTSGGRVGIRATATFSSFNEPAWPSSEDPIQELKGASGTVFMWFTKGTARWSKAGQSQGSGQWTVSAPYDYTWQDGDLIPADAPSATFWINSQRKDGAGRPFGNNTSSGSGSGQRTDVADTVQVEAAAAGSVHSLDPPETTTASAQAQAINSVSLAAWWEPEVSLAEDPAPVGIAFRMTPFSWASALHQYVSGSAHGSAGYSGSVTATAEDTQSEVAPANGWRAGGYIVLPLGPSQPTNSAEMSIRADASATAYPVAANNTGSHGDGVGQQIITVEEIPHVHVNAS